MQPVDVIHHATAASVAILATYAFVAAAWPVRRLEPAVRGAILAPLGLCTLAVPFALPIEPLVPRAVVALVCPTIGVKLVNLGVEAAYWRTRTAGAWLSYLALPFVLVPRVHARAPVGAAGVRQLLGGLLCIGAGVALLAWAFQADLGRWSFALDHFVKLVAAYLCVFDGLFVLGTGLLRIAGVRVLDLSRNPILAVTPAEFWRRYNCEVNRFGRENVYSVLRARLGRTGAMLAVFGMSGILHEYLAAAIIGRVQGYQLAFFGVNAIAAGLTWRRRPQGWAVWPVRLATILFLASTSVLFFGSVAQFIRWYPHGGLLP